MAPSQKQSKRYLTRRKTLTSFGAIGAFGIAGCLSDDDDDDGGDDGAAGVDDTGGSDHDDDDDELSGRIQASGSNTVAPITQIAGEDFENAYPGVAVAVEPEGTGAGFQEFCRANSAFQSASREILEDEIDLCGENDVEYTQYTIGQDGLAVGVHGDNDWCEDITLDELNQIWDFESDVERWNDVRDEWPDESIALHARDSASGTFDYFTEAINGEVGMIRDDYSATSQTDEVWEAVNDNPYAMGWGGLGHLRELQGVGGDLQTVAVESDQDGEFYHPEEEHIESGVYSPLARPLFFYFNHASLEEEPDLIGSFARFYINQQHEFAEEVGFFRATDDDIVNNHDQLEDVLNDIGYDPDDLTVERQDP